MKIIITYICLIMSTAMIAQSTMTNTTTITVDKKIDGKIVQEVFVLEGAGADEKLKELEKDLTVVSINVEKQVEMRSDDPNSTEMQKIRKEVEVEISDLEKVTGQKAERREENVEIEVTAHDQKEIKKYKVKIIENGVEEVIEWNGEGEMPENLKKLMNDTETIINVKENKSGEEHQYKVTKNNGLGKMQITSEDYEVTADENTNSGQIGVMVSGGDEGVEILSFTENSMARAAGLEIGDVITAVNSKAVSSIENLVDALSQYEPGDVVSINYNRGDRKLTKEVRLNKR